MKVPKRMRFRIQSIGDICFEICQCKSYSVYSTFDEAKAALIRRQRAKVKDELEKLREYKAFKLTDVYADTNVRREGDDFVPAACNYNCGCDLTLRESTWLSDWYDKYYKD